MSASLRTYTIDALMAEGFTRREIYRYVYLGVLPHALGAGRSAHYTDQHIKILRDIKAARDERRTLADIASYWQEEIPHVYEVGAGNAEASNGLN